MKRTLFCFLSAQTAPVISWLFLHQNLRPKPGGTGYHSPHWPTGATRSNWHWHTWIKASDKSLQDMSWYTILKQVCSRWNHLSFIFFWPLWLTHAWERTNKHITLILIVCLKEQVVLQERMFNSVPFVISINLNFVSCSPTRPSLEIGVTSIRVWAWVS